MYNSSLRDRDFYFDNICESDYKDALLADAGYFLDLTELPLYLRGLEVDYNAICYPFYEEI